MADNAPRPSNYSHPPSYSHHATHDDGASGVYDQEVIAAQPQAYDEAQSCALVFLLYTLFTRLRVAENTPPRIAHNQQDALSDLASVPSYDAAPSPLPALAWTGAARRASRPRRRRLLSGPDVGEQPPPYALSINETTWSFLTDLLELRISLAVYFTSADGIDVPTTIIDERALRALFMQAITWYIDRECIPLAGAQVAFIGRQVGEDANTQYPCLPIADVREIAEQLPLDGVGITALANFDPFMFCAGDFFPDLCGYWYLFFLVLFCVVVSGIFAFAIARFFIVVWPVVTFVVGDDTVKFLVKFILKLSAVIHTFEDYVLHVGVVIFGFIEFTIHFIN